METLNASQLEKWHEKELKTNLDSLKRGYRPLNPKLTATFKLNLSHANFNLDGVLVGWKRDENGLFVRFVVPHQINQAEYNPNEACNLPLSKIEEERNPDFFPTYELVADNFHKEDIAPAENKFFYKVHVRPGGGNWDNFINYLNKCSISNDSINRAYILHNNNNHPLKAIWNDLKLRMASIFGK
ncbi:hypothetical protein GF340_01700 [Candidatus Peregrinibacteria bacterium]|nr:hypothetical protein [Candidatus Peregrinibacteria bacterium]